MGGAGGFGIIDGETDSVGALTAKAQLLKRPTGGVALQVLHLAVDDEDDATTLYSAVGSKCFGADCRTLVSVHVTIAPFSAYAYDDEGSEGERDGLAVIPGASMVTGSDTKLVLDGVIVGDESDRFAVLYAGVRFARRSFSFDAGLVSAPDGDNGGTFPVPLCALTGRF